MLPVDPKYKATSYKPHSWSEIQEKYEWLMRGEEGWKIQPMIELVKHIRSSGLCDRLFGSTSLDWLHITIYDSIEPGREQLVIRFDEQTRKWSFKYLPYPFRAPEFEREYDADKGIEKLENILRLLKW
jgi:hypothetical protein